MTISFKAQQRGGTVLGLIIGALVGLGAALAVAVYVTKVPVPFLNKTPSKAADTDAAEAKKNKNWDPNVPLAGKPVAKSAASSAGMVGAPTLPGPAVAPDAPDAPDTPALPTAPPVAAKPKVSADPLGDLAKAKTEAKVDVKISAKTEPKGDASAGSGADPFSYFVQAGAFRTPEDAEQQRARLVLLGFQARVTEREQSGRTVYRVRLGPFDKKDDADRNKEKLDSNGVETALVRVQR